MMTRMFDRCPWGSRSADFWGMLALAGMSVWAGMGHAGELDEVAPLATSPDVGEVLDGGAPLYLEVVLNLVPLKQIEPFIVRSGRLFADARTLQRMGLVWPGAETAHGLVALDSLVRLQHHYDVARQRLVLIAPVDMLSHPVTELGYQPPPPPTLDPATRAPGLLFNYDVYGQRDHQSHSLGGWTEWRLFGAGPGVWRSSSALQVTGQDQGPDRHRHTRLDTSWQMDFPERMLTVTVGDAYSSAVSWSRSLHFGGLRISRNFDLQPYRVTVPLASFVGDTAMPSVVDLYINGIREAQNQVNPGRFHIAGAPVLNGAGHAQMVITDITGQSRVVNFPLYHSTRLLQQGLSDWSLEVGRARRDYGRRSFAYSDRTLVSGSLRYGVSNRFTLARRQAVSPWGEWAGCGGWARPGACCARPMRPATAGARQGASTAWAMNGTARA